jgi:hypothetical protein
MYPVRGKADAGQTIVEKKKIAPKEPLRKQRCSGKSTPRKSSYYALKRQGQTSIATRMLMSPASYIS